MKGSIKLEGTTIDYKDTEICVTNQTDEFVGVPDAFIKCDEIKKILCGKVVGCKKDNADLKKLKDLTIVFGKVSLNVSPKELIYFDDKNNV